MFQLTKTKKKKKQILISPRENDTLQNECREKNTKSKRRLLNIQLLYFFCPF